MRLIVEVADATLKNDLTVKAAIYARHGVPEYWVVDLNAGIIHQLWHPHDASYGERREATFGARITAATIDGLSLETGGI